MGIRAEELRIGNWVYQGEMYGDTQCTAYEIYGFTGASNAQYYQEWKPISITEKWLERFGFEEELDPEGVAHGIKVLESAHVDQILVVEIYENKCLFQIGETSYWTASFPIKYVHQLQNLYYALTGKELEIKEK